MKKYILTALAALAMAAPGDVYHLPAPITVSIEANDAYYYISGPSSDGTWEINVNLSFCLPALAGATIDIRTHYSTDITRADIAAEAGLESPEAVADLTGTALRSHATQIALRRVIEAYSTVEE